MVGLRGVGVREQVGDLDDVAVEQEMDLLLVAVDDGVMLGLGVGDTVWVWLRGEMGTVRDRVEEMEGLAVRVDRVLDIEPGLMLGDDVSEGEEGVGLP